MSTTRSDVTTALNYLSAEARKAGIDTSLWVLQEGSPMNGRAYRLFALDPETGSLGPTGLPDYLGVSKAFAIATLNAYSAGLRLAREARPEAKPERDAHDGACTDLTGHLPGQPHRAQDCPTYR